MTKFEIYIELRKLGYAKQKALKLARKAEPFVINAMCFHFTDRGIRYVVNSDIDFVMRTREPEFCGRYADFWEKVCA